MLSAIKIDYLDRGTGIGMEPVIKVQIKKSDDPRDTLVSYLFESLHGIDGLQLELVRSKPIATEEGLPDSEKTYLLFKPQIKEEYKRCYIEKVGAELLAIESLIPDKKTRDKVSTFLKEKLKKEQPEYFS